MIEDIERLTLVQSQVINLRRLAAETFDRQISRRLFALADEIERPAHARQRFTVGY